MSVSTLNRVRYVGADFDTLVDDLRSQLQANYADDFNDFALSSLGIMLIDVISYGLDAVSFYADRKATEAYMATARTRKAVSRLARQLGYKMGAAVASSVDLSVSLTTTYAFDVPIPKGYQFKGPNDLIFEVAQAVTFTAGSAPGIVKTIPCYEGESVTETFVSDGSPDQIFELRRVPDSKYVVFGSVLVTVNGASWTESEFLTVETTNQFEVGYNDDPPSIRFGNGTAGNIPVAGASIVINYVATRGKSGQADKGTITTPVTALVVNFTTIPLTITNPKKASGGDDVEDLDHARSFAGRVFKARQVAVTRSDYEALAGSYADPLAGRVAVAQAISARSAASDLTLQNLLADITVAVEAPKPAVDTATAAIEAALATISTHLASIQLDLGSIATYVSAANTQTDTAIASARAVKNSSNEIEVDAVDIQTQVVSGKAAVDAIATAGTSQLTVADKNALKGWFDLINGEATEIASQASSLETSAASEITAMGAVKDNLALIGLTPASGELLSADTLRADIATMIGVVGTQVDAIQTAVVDVTGSVGTAVEEINKHVDALLSSDCKANLVVVPILARDAAGFYAAPSTTLIQSLQNHLDGRKEVTQTVSVTSGAPFLVAPTIVVRIGITVGISTQVTKSAAEAVVDGVLRGRKFGKSLYITDLSTPLRAIAGVSFANVTLTDSGGGTLDGNGNLIITASQVITKGVVTVQTPEVLTEE